MGNKGSSSLFYCVSTECTRESEQPDDNYSDVSKPVKPPLNPGHGTSLLATSTLANGVSGGLEIPCDSESLSSFMNSPFDIQSPSIR